MSDEVVKKQIEGFCEEISEKNDWITFNINVGSQYPVRLSTKLEALIKQGREAKKERAVWSFSESQGGENPNKPGTHYINRRLEKVEVGGALDPAQARGGPAGNAGGRSLDERLSIERQTIVKAAPEPTWIKTEEDWWEHLDKLDSWMQHPRKGADAAVAKAAPAGDPGPAQPASEFPEDDDIPFLWVDTYGADPTIRWRQ
jgi:hypothetical protein